MFQSLLSCHPGGIHSHTILNIPEYISDEAKSFLKEVSLLTRLVPVSVIKKRRIFIF
jgi:hypothetical protein